MNRGEEELEAAIVQVATLRRFFEEALAAGRSYEQTRTKLMQELGVSWGDAADTIERLEKMIRKRLGR